MPIVQFLVPLTILFIIPTLLGTLLGTRSFGRMYLGGVLLLWTLFECVSMISIKTRTTFSQTIRLFHMALLLALLIATALLVYRKFFKTPARKALAGFSFDDNKAKLYEILRILPAFLLSATPFFLYQPLLDFRYALPETVTTILGTDSLHRYNPLTGEMFLQDPFWIEKLYNLPAFYAWLSATFRCEPILLLFKVIPVWILFCSFVVFYQLASTFFEKEAKGRVLFMWFYAALLLCGDGVYMTESYQILHYAYEGSAILACVLMPYLLLVLFGDSGCAFGARSVSLLEIGLVLVAGVLVTRTAFGAGLLGVMILLSVMAHMIFLCISYRDRKHLKAKE